MKQSLRFFSLGIFVSTVVMGMNYWIGPNEQAESTATMDEIDMINEMEAGGYNVLTDEQLQEKVNQAVHSQTTAASKEESTNETDGDERNQADEVESQEKDSEEGEENKTKTYTLVIEEGISSTDISQTLEQQGIIEDAESFDIYLSDRKLTQYIQIGEFELSESMNRDEVADTITR
ncbi:hypothetical protein [Halobacillus sp. B23F22_1]|uniref:hypothetical protein n=1 Tax=Halobacillus sp. B23F22_1 TaxID=3459514 RepID=UPI00373E0DD2